MKVDVSKIVAAYARRMKDRCIQFRSHIPPKKLENAVQAIAPGVERGDVLVLLDNTVFHSAEGRRHLDERPSSRPEQWAGVKEYCLG